MKRYTIKDLDTQFPDNDACLEFIKDARWPSGITCAKCSRVTKHFRIRTKKVYGCEFCGTQVSPTADTIFHKSATPLRYWFHAMFLMASTRTGISAKQLEREIGVTYKTAWRMFREIRKLMDEDTDPFSGGVEVDVTFVGGKAINMHKAKREATIRGRGSVGKTPVFGMVERKGNVVATVVAEESRSAVLPKVREKILPNSLVYSDEHAAYDPLESMGYQHKRVHHSAKIYVQGDAHTNTIEGFWSLVKRGIGGVNHAVSATHLQGYINSYSFRWNHRDDEESMFITLLARIPHVA